MARGQCWHPALLCPSACVPRQRELLLEPKTEHDKGFSVCPKSVLHIKCIQSSDSMQKIAKQFRKKYVAKAVMQFSLCGHDVVEEL